MTTIQTFQRGANVVTSNSVSSSQIRNTEIVIHNPAEGTKGLSFRVGDNIYSVSESGAITAISNRIDGFFDGAQFGGHLIPASTLSVSAGGILTQTNPDGTLSSVNLPLASLFKSASYDTATQDVTFTLNNDETLVIDLSTLVDAAELILGTANPTLAPTTGQREYINTASKERFVNVANEWVSVGKTVTQAELDALALTVSAGSPLAIANNQISLNVDSNVFEVVEGALKLKSTFIEGDIIA